MKRFSFLPKYDGVEQEQPVGEQYKASASAPAKPDDSLPQAATQTKQTTQPVATQPPDQNEPSTTTTQAQTERQLGTNDAQEHAKSDGCEEGTQSETENL